MAKVKIIRSRSPVAAEQTAERSLLDDIVEQGRLGTDVATRERGKNLGQGIHLPDSRRRDDGFEATPRR